MRLGLGSCTLAALAFVSMPGCTVGPRFTEPTADVPDGWSPTSRATVDVSETSPAAIGAWWTRFEDPLLVSLIERAVGANLDVQQAALRIAEARAQRDITGAQRWPQIALGASYQRARVSENTLLGTQLSAAERAGATIPNPYSLYHFGPDLSWELDLFGRVRRGIEAADADTLAAREDRNALLVAIAGDVTRAYLEIRGAQLSMDITREALRTERDLLQLTRQRFRAGLITEIDVANAAALAAATEAQIPTLERQIAQGINQLSLLLAREPDALRGELQPTSTAWPAAHQIPIGAPAELARRRPDIRRAEARLHAATARLGVAIADLFPRLTLSASFGWEAESTVTLADWASRFYMAGPQLEIPIYTGGARRATVRLQDIRAKEAALDYRRTVLTALHEVENAMVAIGTEQARRASLVIAVASNKDAAMLTQQRYTNGLASFLEVLDAQRTLQQNQLQLADSDTSIAIGLAALYRALGGGWEMLAPKDDTASP